MEDLTEEAYHSQVQELVLLPFILPSWQNVTVQRAVSVGTMFFFQISIRILSGIRSMLGQMTGPDPTILIVAPSKTSVFFSVEDPDSLNPGLETDNDPAFQKNPDSCFWWPKIKYS